MSDKKEFLFELSKECILCHRNFEWHQPVILKIPEGAAFCLECAEKYEDKVTKGWYFMEYEPSEFYLVEEK